MRKRRRKRGGNRSLRGREMWVKGGSELRGSTWFNKRPIMTSLHLNPIYPQLQPTRRQSFDFPMHIPHFVLSALQLASPHRPAVSNDLVKPQHNKAPATAADTYFSTFDICPKMTVRCVKDSNWPSGIVGNIGKKDFCWEGFRCNQCE